MDVKQKSSQTVQFVSFDKFRLKTCDPAGARTQDPNIKSVMLYQLSYRIISRKRGANIEALTLFTKAKANYYQSPC